jgi:hypothetical protein
MLKGMAWLYLALQTFNTLNSNLKFESERVVPLLSIEHMLVCWLVGVLDDVE